MRCYDAKFRCETVTDPVQKRFEVGRYNEVIIESSFLNCNIASLTPKSLDPILIRHKKCQFSPTSLRPGRKVFAKRNRSDA